MKLVTDKTKPAVWAYDLRVRDRLFASGQLDPKYVERYLAELPDLEGHAEELGYAQPALTGADDGEP